MKPRVILVTGSLPPDPCGVGDYTAALASALEKAGQSVELLCHRQWNLAGTLAAISKLSASHDVLVHMQYPTMGYRYSLGPQICSLAKPCIVTLHEFSVAHPLRKVSLFPFTLRSPRIVMTSEFEKRALERCMPWAGSRLRVIPIGSNIPRQPHAVEARNEAIVYFGLIMERKGLEDFIEFSRLVRARSLEWDLSIIGKIAPGKADYCKTLMDSSRPYGVRWILDRDANEVSELLSRAGLAYLPFPDGASERRGSLKAALVAGIPCITRCTEQTSQELFEAVTPAATPLAAVDLAVRLMAAIEDRRRLSRNALEYSKQFSWEKIAESHMQMYEELFAANKNTRK